MVTESGPEMDRKWTRSELENNGNIFKFALSDKAGRKFFEKYKTKILLLLVHWKLAVDSDSITTGKWH